MVCSVQRIELEDECIDLFVLNETSKRQKDGAFNNDCEPSLVYTTAGPVSECARDGTESCNMLFIT